MTMRILFTTMMAFTAAHAQSIWDTIWIYRFEGSGTDKIMGVISDGQGHIVGAGYTDSYSSNYDILLVKLDSSGNLIWSRVISGPGDYDDYAYAIALDSSGYYVVAGYTRSFSNGADNDGWILKLDPETGDIIWTAVVGTPSNDYLMDILITPEGNYLSAGYTYHTSSGYTGAFFTEISPSGDSLWSSIYSDGVFNLRIYALDMDDAGNIISVGTATSSDYSIADGFLLKTDSAGNLIWSNYLDMGGYDRFTDVIIDSDGNYMAIGYNEDYGTFDAWIVKVDSFMGSTLWNRRAGGTDDDYAYSIFRTTSGNHVIGGYTLSYGVQGTGLYMLEMDGDGNILDSAVIDLSPSSDVIYSGGITSGTHFILAGYTNGGDAFIAKLRGEAPTKEMEKHLPIEISITDGGFSVKSEKTSILEIYSPSGKLLRKSIIQGRKHIDMQTAGTYILKIRNGRKLITMPIVIR